jgi:hypothetical protein
MTWLNSDGLYVKFSKEEADAAQGGEFNSVDGIHTYSFKLDYSDALSATHAIVNGGASTLGPYGIVLPEGLRLIEVETIVQTAFTSSGVIADGELDLGLVQRDRSTAILVNGLLAAFDTLNINVAGEHNVIRVGSTGAGALLGTTLSQDGIIVAANLQHATVPFTGGVLRVYIRGYFP